MLGTNDFQFPHPWNTAWSAAEGVAALVAEIRRAPIEPGMPMAPVLVICPPTIHAKGAMAEKFAGAEARCAGLAEAYRAMTSRLECGFFDAGGVTESSRVDGVHLDRDQHLTLGKALTGPVRGNNGVGVMERTLVV